MPGSWERSCSLERQLTAETRGLWERDVHLLGGPSWGRAQWDVSRGGRGSAGFPVLSCSAVSGSFQLGCWKLQADDEGV